MQKRISKTIKYNPALTRQMLINAQSLIRLMRWEHNLIYHLKNMTAQDIEAYRKTLKFYKKEDGSACVTASGEIL